MLVVRRSVVPSTERGAHAEHAPDGVCPLGECERRTRNRRVTTVSSTGNFLAPPRSGALAIHGARRASLSDASQTQPGGRRAQACGAKGASPSLDLPDMTDLA